MKVFFNLKALVFGSGAVGFGGWQLQKKFQFSDCHAEEYDYRWDTNWDGMSSVRNKGVRHIILIRHGQYVTKTSDPAKKVLTELGRNQAKALGVFLGEFTKSLDIPLTKIVASTMVRATETCDIACGQFITDKNILENIDYTDLIREGPPILPEPPSSVYKPSDSEIRECQTRLDKGFEKYFSRPLDDGSTLEIYFCHGNVIRYYLCKFLQLPLNAWLRFNIRHCSVTWIKLRGSGRVTCSAYGDAGFMPAEMLTTS